jgi:xanthine/CO dehydrogenase XdhC/CoxF family maturation factor
MNRRYPLSQGDAEVFLERWDPIPLVIFGATPNALPLVRLVKELGWHVTVVDHRPAYARPDRFPLADEVLLCQAEEVKEKVLLTRRTLAVVITHNYLYDEELLPTLLDSSVRYIGILGSKSRTEKLLADLSHEGMSVEDAGLQRIHSPIGLDIGAEAPEELALAIVSEIQAFLTQHTAGFLKNRTTPLHGS